MKVRLFPRECMVNPYKYKINKKLKMDVVHRIVMSEYLGRDLEYDEVVHHIDNNPKNNNIKNLRLMTRYDHSKLHSKPAPIIYIRCNYCKKLTPKIRSNYLHKCKCGITKFYCSKSCSNKTKKPPHNNKLSESELHKIINDYTNGKSGYIIAKEMKKDRSTIYFVLKNNNINIKPRPTNYSWIDNILIQEFNIIGAWRISKKYNIPYNRVHDHVVALKKRGIL